MPYHVLVSKTFQKQFSHLQSQMQDRIRKKLRVLQKDPFAARAKADIKPLHGTKPLKYRLRIGSYRIIYLVQEKEVRIIELIKREKGYRVVG